MSFTLIKPQPNLNGDSVDELVRQHMKVKRAAAKLLDAMQEAFPHGRNYQTCDYPQEELQCARLEWQIAMKQVESVHDQAGEVAGHCFKFKRRHEDA